MSFILIINQAHLKDIAHIMQVFENRNLKYADIVISANMERSKIMKEYFKLKSLPIVFDNIHKINDKYDIEECDKNTHNILTEVFYCLCWWSIETTYDLRTSRSSWRTWFRI